MKNLLRIFGFLYLAYFIVLIFSCSDDFESNIIDQQSELNGLTVDLQKLSEVNQLLIENGYAPYTVERLEKIRENFTAEGVSNRSCGATYYGDISNNSCTYSNPYVSGVDLVIMHNIIRDFDYDDDDMVETTNEYDGTTYLACVVQNAGVISYIEGDSLAYHLDGSDIDITAYYILYGVCP
jgi:hypothetical protein